MSKVRSSPNLICEEGKKTSIFDRLGSKSSSKKLAVRKEIKLLSLIAAEASVQKLSFGENTMKKSRHSKKSKDKHRRTTHVAAIKNEEPPDIESLDLRDLEGADEKFLQKRRLQLQRELRLQMKREKKLSSKKPKKAVVASSESSESSSESSTSSSSSTTSSSSHTTKKALTKKRRASVSSDSVASPPQKKRRSPTPPPPPISKVKVDVKKKAPSPRNETTKRQITSKRSVTPNWQSKATTKKRTSATRSKSRQRSPKHKPREPSPRRIQKSKEPRRPSPSHRARTRTRSPERRTRHSPMRSRQGGLEKGGKILPVKPSAYAKKMKNSSTRKSPSRTREDRERELDRSREKKRREEKMREAERRERDAERVKREAERQRNRDREEAIRRSKERERQRERDRIERDKRERKDSRKTESNSELPSLLDIRTEVPAREGGRRGWEDRRPRRGRSNEDFEYRSTRQDVDNEERRGRKSEFNRESTWEGKDGFRQHSPPGKWSRESRDSRPQEPKWTGSRRDQNRERDAFFPRRTTPEWRVDQAPVDEPPEDPANFIDTGLPAEPGCIPPADASADLEDLSDISDDADEILNQDETSSLPTPVVTPQSSAQLQLPVMIPQTNSDFFFDSRRPLLECLGDRGLDFEEISDEELEEDAKIGKGIMDVLGADWSSLMAERPRKVPAVEKESSARRRWHADAIIARIGVSRALAGDSFTDSYFARIRDKSIEGNAASDANKDKVKEGEINGESILGNDIKKDRTLLDPLPAVHSMKAALTEPCAIQRLLNSLSKQALAARADLSIRRVLCGLSAKEPLQLLGSSESAVKLAAV